MVKGKYTVYLANRIGPRTGLGAHHNTEVHMRTHYNNYIIIIYNNNFSVVDSKQLRHSSGNLWLLLLPLEHLKWLLASSQSTSHPVCSHIPLTAS